MTTKRLFAILFIFCCTAVGWFILGGALDLRTGQSSSASWIESPTPGDPS